MSPTSGLTACAPASAASGLTTSSPASAPPLQPQPRIVKPILIFVCLPVTMTFILWCVVTSDLWPDDLRPGIGHPPEKHMETIQVGMTKGEVRAALGRPHRTGSCGGDEWDYRCDFFEGSTFRVYFGADGRVARREWWSN